MKPSMEFKIRNLEEKNVKCILISNSDIYDEIKRGTDLRKLLENKGIQNIKKTKFENSS
jgi:hypothetical protein